LSILQITLERKKILIEITLFSPFVIKTLKREKSCEAKMWCRLLIVLCLLIVASLLLIIVVENMSRPMPKAANSAGVSEA
jgi:hypothetical protein